jgi:hypothetical protein
LIAADVPPSLHHEAPSARCLEPARHYRCPNLTMGPPARLQLRRSRRGRLLLLMDNYLVNEGPGRVHFVGRRTAEYKMKATQIVERTGGRTSLPVETGAKLTWKHVDHYRGNYWKFENAARFELYKLDAIGHRTKLYKLGPKQDYCLRDLFRFRGGPTVPKRPVFGACSQDFTARRDTLGIAVGWADGYPYSYPENWIDVTGRTGCFVVVHRADPLNHVLETDETDNESHKVVRLPYRRGDQRCPRYRGPEADA